MKKILALMILALSLVFATESMAETYGPDFARFTIKPAAGWTASPVEAGVQVTNGKSVMVINVVKDPGIPLKQFAEVVVQQAGLTGAAVSEEGDQAIIKGKKDGVDLAFVLTKAEGNIVNCTFTGPDIDDMRAMLDTLEDAE